MSFLEAVSADTVSCAAQNQSTDTTPDTDASSQSVEDFTSVLMSTLQSSEWLSTLLGCRTDGAGAAYRAQQRLNVVSSVSQRAEVDPRETIESSTSSPSPRDRFYSEQEQPSESDSSQTVATDRREWSERSRVEDRPGDHTRSVDERHSVADAPIGAEAASQGESLSGAAGSSPTQASPAGSAQASFEQGSSGVSDVPADQAVRIEGQTASKVTTELPVAKDAGTQPAGDIVMAQVQSVATSLPMRGGQLGQETSQDLTQAGGAVKAAGVSAKMPANSTDFQSMLQQIGRARGVSSGDRFGSAATASKIVSQESVKLDQAESIEKLARVVQSRLNGKNPTMVLRLDPPELGQLRVDVRMQEQMLTVRFETQTQEGYDTLQSQLTDLKNALKAQGIQLDRLEVELRTTTPPVEQGHESNDQPSQQHLPDGNERGSSQADSRGDGLHRSHIPAETSFEAEQQPVVQSLDPQPSSIDALQPMETGVDVIA